MTEKAASDVHSHNPRGSRRGPEQVWEVAWEAAWEEWAAEEPAMVRVALYLLYALVHGLTEIDRPRFSDREPLPLPTKPPYTAHLGNLTYEVTGADIEDFLKDCQVTNVRIVEDKVDQRPKGFGYVEFATVDGLKKALTYSETNFMGRNVKISVAEPRKSRISKTQDWYSKLTLTQLEIVLVTPTETSLTGHAKDLSQTCQ